jgi:hypothetical protein
MDSGEGSWIIDALSDAIGKFLKGAHASRGIVASRYFKRPTNRLAPGSVYRIKPFDDSRIRRVLQLVGMRNIYQIREVFRSRPDLIATATNPLIANLLATYVREHGGQWPSSKLVLFKDHIERQLSDDAVKARLLEHNITEDKFLTATSAIAAAMMRSEKYGLEIPVNVLTAALGNHPATETLLILKFARLGRISTDSPSNFSFVHRRFQEFFIVSQMLNSQVALDLSAIVKDTRYRDILALYCEVANATDAVQVAEHCWLEIAQHPLSDSRDNVGVVQSLRFLSEAFRTRRIFSSHFQDALEDYIRSQLLHSYRPLTAKFATEAIALLDEERAAALFPLAMEYRSAWVREAAFRACRHLVDVSKRISDAATRLIVGYRYDPPSGRALISNHSELQFSLSISDGFRNVRLMEGLWLFDAIYFQVALGLLVFLSPLIALAALFTLMMLNSALYAFALKPRLIVSGFLVGTALFLGLITAQNYVLGWVLGFPSWWRADVVFFWRREAEAISHMLTWNWLVPTYHVVVSVLLFGLIPAAPLIAHLWMQARSSEAAIRPLNRAASFVRHAMGNLAPKNILNILRSDLFDHIRDFLLFSYRMPRRELVKFIVVIAVSGLVPPLIAGALQFAISRYGAEAVFVVATAISTVCLGCGLFWLLVKWLRQARHDREVLQSCVITAIMQREKIQEVLGALSGEKARLKFVRALLSNHVIAVGAWRYGLFPFKPDDPVSDELVRLEERWLRLD